MEYYLAIKKNVPMPFQDMDVDLEIIILRSKSEKDKYLSLRCEVLKMIQMNLFSKQK